MPVQYVDYTLWQRAQLGDLDDHHSRIAAQLALLGGGAGRHARAAGSCPPIGRIRRWPITAAPAVAVDWPAELQQQVRGVAREHNATSFMVVQAALAVLLSKLSASADVAVGFPIAGRRDPALDDLVGFFVNTLVLRVDLADATQYWHDEPRKNCLWANLLAGGAGVEWYFGYEFPHNDLHCEDWRSRDHLWDLTRLTLGFFQTHLPFAEMSHADELTVAPDDFCLAQPGVVYAIYLPQGGSTTLDLQQHKCGFEVRWFDPRLGGDLQCGSVETVSGPGVVLLGAAPDNPDADWVVLVRARMEP